MAIWPFRRGGGRRRGEPPTDDGGGLAPQAAGAGARGGGGNGSSNGGNGGGNGGGGGPLALPSSLTEFLFTAPGVSWLAEELSDMRGRVPVPRPPTAREFNALVLQAYHKVLQSEAGRRLAEASHAQERAAEDVLTVPLFIVEDFVRQRLRSTLGRNWARYAVVVCSRATLATALVRGLKAGARWLLWRRAPAHTRWRLWADASLDLLLPTELYGAMAGIGLVALRLHKELSEIQPAQPPPDAQQAAAPAQPPPGAGRRQQFVQ